MTTDTDRIIEAFQEKCLAAVAMVTEAATAEIDRLTAENAELREAGETARQIGDESLTEQIDSLQSEIATALQEKAERDSRIANLLRLVNASDERAAANDHDSQADKLAELETQIKDLEEEVSDKDKEIEALRDEVTGLEKDLEAVEIPSSMVLASAAHDFLRLHRLIPANLDAPLRVLPHEYMMGLATAVGSELP